MENKKLKLFLTIFSAALFAILWVPGSVMSEESGSRFSFHFENCTVSDALREISAKSGINIISKSMLKKEILRKAYNNRRLDSIISDLLRGENCAVVWNYDEGNLLSIDLYTFDENDLKSRGTGSYANNSSGQSPSFASRSNDEVNQIRNRYINTNSGRSNRSVSASRPSTQRSSVRKTISKNNPIYGASARKNTRENTVFDTSRVSANIRRAAIKNQNSLKDDEAGEEEEVKNTEPAPTPEEPEKGSGLERPPMPPGM